MLFKSRVGRNHGIPLTSIAQELPACLPGLALKGKKNGIYLLSFAQQPLVCLEGLAQEESVIFLL
jgi:hypothetical protein